MSISINLHTLSGQNHVCYLWLHTCWFHFILNSANNIAAPGHAGTAAFSASFLQRCLQPQPIRNRLTWHPHKAISLWQHHRKHQPQYPCSSRKRCTCTGRVAQKPDINTLNWFDAGATDISCIKEISAWHCPVYQQHVSHLYSAFATTVHACLQKNTELECKCKTS